MAGMEHQRYREWIDELADGGLAAAERAELERHLAACADCRGERERAEAVARRLGAARVAVRPGFAREVLAALEPAPWEARAPRAWRLPLALFVALGAAAAVLAGRGASELAQGGGVLGALFVVGDLLRAAIAAGAGVAAASWRGLGAAVADWLGASAANWVAAAVLAGGANYLLWRLLRARRGAAAERARRAD